jgi:hypothetical protein
MDAGFLHHDDQNIRASKLVAEWPPRYERPDLDPLADIHLTSANPVFAYYAHGKNRS